MNKIDLKEVKLYSGSTRVNIHTHPYIMNFHYKVYPTQSLLGKVFMLFTAEYQLHTKVQAKMLFFYYVGELNFRTNRPREAIQKFGGVNCLVGVCCGVDSLAHIVECHGYNTKVPSNMREEDLSEYLLNIHRERVRRWSAPLIMTDLSSIVNG